MFKQSVIQLIWLIGSHKNPRINQVVYKSTYSFAVAPQEPMCSQVIKEETDFFMRVSQRDRSNTKSWSGYDTNRNSWILKWRYCTIFLAIFCGDIPLHRKIGLIYGIGTSNEQDPVAWPLMLVYNPMKQFGISAMFTQVKLELCEPQLSTLCPPQMPNKAPCQLVKHVIPSGELTQQLKMAIQSGFSH